MNWRVLFFVLTLVVAGSACAVSRGQEKAASTVVRDSTRHVLLDRVLERFVDASGNVDYEALQALTDTVLTPYLNQLASARLAPLDRDARLALWINAYNALALELIVDHYPVKNIWTTTPGPATPTKENSPFDMEVGTVADTVRTLDEIEHEIIRKRFDEPRIHFALVCAAKSCPQLRREAYTGPRLDDQLDDQARRFLHNNRKNRIPTGHGTIALSRIFKWYGTDFGPTLDAVQRFSASYFEGAIQDSLARAAYEVQFLSYDWTLNAQSLDWGDGDAVSGPDS